MFRCLFGHQWGAWQYRAGPTQDECIQTRQCMRCNREDAQPITHTWSRWEKQDTHSPCWSTRHCTNCGKAETKITHSFGACTYRLDDVGDRCIQVERCYQCGYERVERTGHSWSAWTRTESPTDCTVARHCVNCQREETDTQHEFGEWLYVELESNRQIRECEICTYTEERNNELPARVRGKQDEEKASDHQKIARGYVQSGEYELARHHFKLATLAQPEDAYAYYLWGRFELSLDNLEHAESLLQKALTYSKSHSLAWAALGGLKAQKGNLDAARAIFQDGIKSGFKNAPIWIKWARSEADQGYYQRARKVFRQAIAIYPNNNILWREMGILERNLDNVEDARYAFKRATETNPDDQIAFNIWAGLELWHGNYDKAHDLVLKSLAIQKDYHALITYGEILRARNQSQDGTAILVEAEEMIKQMAMCTPQDYKLHSDYSRVLRLLGKYEQSMTALEISLQHSSYQESQFACFGIGEIYFAQGQIGRAIQTWEDALVINPYNLLIRNKITWLCELYKKHSIAFLARDDDVVDAEFEEVLSVLTQESQTPVIKKLFKEKGYGFIYNPISEGKRTIFFHFTEVLDGVDSLKIGVKVGYESRITEKGTEAYDIEILS